ncbi:type IX secretion system protein PorD [Rhizosphaericola mali]|uniref:type IX secretion system protein PorD n=1 Tax=Rhizosphaericola mali TaxID=2545455 RepID=UPI0017875A69|nr:DUF4835 family protein [Rhizosphaericola mali]
MNRLFKLHISPQIKFAILFSGLLLCTLYSYSQEFNAKVTVLSQQVQSTISKSIFTNLQTQLTNLINNKAWTKDKYSQQERILCNFILNISSADNEGYMKGVLTVQAARPIYNSTYTSQLFNYQDNDIVFRYLPNQNMDFNENRITGTDPLVSNLTAVFAFYLDVILGYNYDSFGLNEGIPYFKKAQNIVVSAPTSTDITGWQSFNSLRNRYWISENANNQRYNVLHNIIYNYFRNGLDNMYSNKNQAQSSLYQTLSQLQQLNVQNPNTMFVQLFTQLRSPEFLGIFTAADQQTKSSAKSLLMDLDPANSSKYDSNL